MNEAIAIPEGSGIRINPRDPFLVTDSGKFGMRRLPATRILGVPVSLVDMSSAVREIVRWAQEGLTSMVCARDTYSLVCVTKDPMLQEVHERASMITPDGMPLAVTGKLRGHGSMRVSGPTLMEEVCRATAGTGIRHYFYGGKEGVADLLAANLEKRFPGIAVAGTRCPPFGSLSQERDEAEVAAIRAARPNIVWIGMSSPRQDVWMFEHIDRLPGMVLVAVGAAFDFHAGTVKRAPLWMQRRGLEWLFRLVMEPQRLWRRYLLVVPQFLWQMLIKGDRLTR